MLSDVTNTNYDKYLGISKCLEYRQCMDKILHTTVGVPITKFKKLSYGKFNVRALTLFIGNE